MVKQQSSKPEAQKNSKVKGVDWDANRNWKYKGLYVEEVVRYFGVTPTTLRTYLKEEKLEAKKCEENGW